MVVFLKCLAQRVQGGKERVVVEDANPFRLGADVLHGRPQHDKMVLVDGEVGITVGGGHFYAMLGEKLLEGSEVVVRMVHDDGHEKGVGPCQPVLEGWQPLDHPLVVCGDAEGEVAVFLLGRRRGDGDRELVAWHGLEVRARGEVDVSLLGGDGPLELGDHGPVDVIGELGLDASPRVDDVVAQLQLLAPQELDLGDALAGLERRPRCWSGGRCAKLCLLLQLSGRLGRRVRLVHAGDLVGYRVDDGGIPEPAGGEDEYAEDEDDEDWHDSLEPLWYEHGATFSCRTPTKQRLCVDRFAIRWRWRWRW